jgi:Flp pilus assembly protein TadG
MTRRLGRENGQSAVELALVLPIVLLLLLGIVQFGSLFRDYIALTDATRIGARQASVSRSLSGTDAQKEAQVITVTKNAGVNLNPNNMTVTVTRADSVGNPTTTWPPGGQVTVRSTYPFKINLIGLVFFTGTVKSRTTERIE